MVTEIDFSVQIEGFPENIEKHAFAHIYIKNSMQKYHFLKKISYFENWLSH